jgi:hypothetical protein
MNLHDKLEQIVENVNIAVIILPSLVVLSPDMTHHTSYIANYRAVIVTALRIEYDAVRAYLKDICAAGSAIP